MNIGCLINRRNCLVFFPIGIRVLFSYFYELEFDAGQVYLPVLFCDITNKTS